MPSEACCCCGCTVTASLICWPKEFTRPAKVQAMGNRCNLFSGRNGRVTEGKVQRGEHLGPSLLSTSPILKHRKPKQMNNCFSEQLASLCIGYIIYVFIAFLTLNLFSVLVNTFLCYNFENNFLNVIFEY